jgi:two-component system chemotaxis sensor kinase CheA
MSSNNEKLSEDLGLIIQSLADAWPNDRENVAIAGAKFEEVLSDYDLQSGQLKRLTDLSWEGIKHLYQKDDFFMMVKSATMQAINTFREFILHDGDIKVEEFERSFEDLEKSLKGGAESADTVIDLDEETIAKLQQEEAEKKAKEAAEKKAESKEEEPIKEYSLDDLASFIMTLDEESAKEEELEELAAILKGALVSADETVSKPLEEALELVVKVQEGNEEKEWFSTVSAKTEEAINAESQAEWEESTADAAPEPVVEEVKEAPSKAEAPVEEEAPSVEEQTQVAEVEDSEVFLVPEDIEIGMVGEFITECSELIEMAESALLDLEERPDDDELINTVFRAFHTIKGTSAFMGLDPISEFTHSVETFLSMVRDGDLKFDRAGADISLESIDIINKLLAIVEHAEPGDPLPTTEQYSSMLRVLHDVSDEEVEPAEALEKERDGKVVTEFTETDEVSEESEADASAKADTDADSTEKASKSDSESSVRVSVSRLDRLIDMVGELVIAHSVVAQDKAIPKDSELQKKVNHATKILRELQDTSLTLRMVPLKATFHKMNRLVRDLSRKAGKRVRFQTYGEDTEIDRNMVDIINEPLIHMLRNSLDHGIEDADERKGTDKDDTATIFLRASQEGGKVVIEIEDDGRGIDKDKIFNKAVEKGLIDPDKKLTEKEIYGLIFLPGFSSAEKVTDLSGRGVGMDVVRRSIEQLQGKVEVSSELGKGTTITIELPFTLAITDGMLVRVAGERFIVPTINIDMTFRAEEHDLFTVMGDSEQVNFRGKSVPVIRLHRLFDIEGANESLLEGTMLVIKNNNSRYALLVDEVIGQQQLVGKSINMIGKTEHISGGAILGDGRVGLILDTAALMD